MTVATKSFLEKIADSKTKPLVGMEYVVVFENEQNGTSLFFCVLCEKECTLENIQQHITSHRHKMKYLDLHFPSFMAKANKNRKFNSNMEYREAVLSKIAGKIEEITRRRKPLICDISRFENNKENVFNEARNEKHFDETDWSEGVKTFSEILKAFQDDYNSDSSEEDEDFDDSNYPDQRSFNNSDFLNSSTTTGHLIPRPKNPTLEEVKQKEEAQQKHAKDVVKYKSHIEKAIKKLQESFKDYERNPQQHPMYVKEWKMFWSRKFKEVLEKGKDANSYDYIPEWTAFWNERVQDLHRMDVEKVKEELRKQFGLSFKEVEAINKLEKSAEQNEEPTSLSANFPFSKHQLIVEEPVESLFSELSFCHNKENDLEPIVSYEVLGGPENLAALCQLLMKFIPELGLFAEAIYDLLGKSVALERVKQNSSNELLLSVGNCNVLETVKEKLEGISTVNMIAPNKFFEVKRAVNSITTLLNEGCSRKSVSSSSEVKKRDCESVDLQRDIKMEISTRIAELLTTQDGMTLSSEELDAWVETLINENFVDFPDVKKVKKSET